SLRHLKLREQVVPLCQFQSSNSGQVWNYGTSQTGQITVKLNMASRLHSLVAGIEPARCLARAGNGFVSLIPSGHDDRCDNIPGGNGSVPDSDFVLTTSSRLNCDRLSSKNACFG